MSNKKIKEIDILALMDTTDIPEGTVSIEDMQNEEMQKYQDRVPKDILIIPFGKNQYTVDGEEGEFEFDQNDAQKIIDNFSKRGKDLVIDKEHATLNDPQNADAHGWVKSVEVKDDGLYGCPEWHPEMAKKIAEKQWRYMSPVIEFDDNNRPCSLQSMAITNHPAMHSPRALAASDTSGIVPDAEISLLGQVKENIKSSLALMNDLMKDYSGDEKIKAFADTGFPELMVAFADATDMGDGNATIEPVVETTTVEIPELTEIMLMKKQDAITALESMIAIETDPDRKQILEQKLQEVMSWADEIVNNQVAETPTETVSTETAIPQNTVAMNDVSAICEATGIVAKDQSGLIEEIKSLKSIADKSSSFLNIHGFSDFTKATASIMQKEIDSEKKVEEVKTVVALNDTTAKANELVNGAMKDMKIRASQKDSMLKWAFSDYTGAKDFIYKQKAFKDTSSPVQTNQSATQTKTMVTVNMSDITNKMKTGQAFTDAEISFVKANADPRLVKALKN
jgi:phage I-like protein